MEQSLLAQCAKAKQTPATIERLILDHCAASRLQDLAQCKNLVSLSIINAGLHSLEGFPSLMRLRTLELSDNRIVGNGLEALANAGLPSITKLNLSGNRLATLDNLRPLGKLTTLRNLDLFNCPVTNQPGYRQKVLDMLPKLELLDGTNRAGEEVDDEDDDDEEDEEDEDEDDEGEEEAAPGAAAAPKKRKAADEEESSEEDDEEEEEDANANAKKQQGGMRMPPKRSAPAKAAESGSDEEDESSSEEGAPAQAPAAAGEEEEESSEEEEAEAEAGAKRRKADEEEEEEEESSSEEER